jgi:multidrug efflux system outer membrane protein
MSAVLVVKRVAQIDGAALLLVLLLAGCMVGPNYKRPVVEVPGSYRQDPAPDIAPDSSLPFIADEQWAAIFQEPTLR